MACFCWFTTNIFPFSPFPHRHLQFKFQSRSEEQIAPVTCLCAYSAELGSRLRALASWPAHLGCLVSAQTQLLSTRWLVCCLPTSLDRDTGLNGFRVSLGAFNPST
jgi:hypothetical protein